MYQHSMKQNMTWENLDPHLNPSGPSINLSTWSCSAVCLRSSNFQVKIICVCGVQGIRFLVGCQFKVGFHFRHWNHRTRFTPWCLHSWWFEKWHVPVLLALSGKKIEKSFSFPLFPLHTHVRMPRSFLSLYFLFRLFQISTFGWEVGQFLGESMHGSLSYALIMVLFANS